MKPFFHIIISIGVIMVTAIITGLVFNYNTAKIGNDILFVFANTVFLAATIWIVINAVRMVKQGGGL